MSQSLLGLQNRGTGFPAAFRVIGGGSPIQIGTTFMTQLIGSVTGGPFVVNEVVSHSAGAQTATVVQVFSGRLILRSMSAGWAPSTGTITGGTSGATAPGAGAEGLEHNGSAANRRAACRVIQSRNELFAFHYNTIYKFNQTTSHWEENYRRTNLAAPDATGESNSKTGMYSLEISGIVNLVAMFYVTSGTAGIYRLKSADNGATWSELRVSTNTWPTDGSPLATIWQNIVYVNQSSNNGHDSWNPATDGYSRVANSFALDNPCNRHVVWQGRFFMISRNGNPDLQLSEFTGGTYVSRYAGNGSHVLNNSGQFGAFVAPDGNLRVFVQHYSLDDLYSFKITTAFAVTDISSISPGGNNQRRVECYVDQETNCLAGGPIVPFIWITTDDTTGTSRSYYEYTNDATQLTQLSSGCPVEVALPNDSHGAGERSWFPGELDVQPSAVPTPILGGQRIFVKVYKQPGTSNVTAVKLRLLFGQTGEVPRTFGTLANPTASPPGPSLAVSGGNEITGIVADSTTEYSFDWTAISNDGLANFSETQYCIAVHV